MLKLRDVEDSGLGSALHKKDVILEHSCLDGLEVFEDLRSVGAHMVPAI